MKMQIVLIFFINSLVCYTGKVQAEVDVGAIQKLDNSSLLNIYQVAWLETPSLAFQAETQN